MIDLIHGDCLQVLPEIDSGTVDLIVADMPYGTTCCNWDSLIDLNALWPELIRVCKPSAAIIMFAQTPFDKVLGASNLKLLKYEWIWEKTNATGFFNAKKMPLKAHENILVFYDKLPTYNFIKTTGHPRKTAGRKDVNSDVYGKAVKKVHYDSTERYPRDVLKFKSDKQNSRIHPTQKPLALIEYLVKTYSNEGDMVLDFCMGSGTTPLACKNLNRKAIGIEKELKYYTSAVDRINEAC